MVLVCPLVVLERDSNADERTIDPARRMPGLALREKLATMDERARVLVIDGDSVVGDELRYLLEGDSLTC